MSIFYNMHVTKKSHDNDFVIDIVLVTACNRAYRRWFYHLRQNLKFFGLHDRLLICEEKDSGGTALTFGTRDYFSLLHRRQQCFWKVLYTRPPGAHLLVIDTDITLFRNPVEALERLPLESRMADIVALDDTGPNRPPGYRNFKRYLNCGFLLLRNTPATVALGRAFQDELLRRTGENDQEVFNAIVWSRARKHLVKVNVLPADRFFNGYRFFEEPTSPRVNPSIIVAVHHNWVRGDRRKWNRGIDYRALLTNRSETYSEFWRRARIGMSMPAWNWRA